MTGEDSGGGGSKYKLVLRAGCVYNRREIVAAVQPYMMLQVVYWQASRK